MALIGKHGNTLENHEKTWDHHGKTLDNHGQKLVSPKCYRSPGVSGYYHKVWIFLRLFPSFNSGITPFPCGFCQGWWHRTSSACSLLLVAAGQKKSRDGDHGLWANMVMPKPKYLCQLSSWDGQPNLLTPKMFDFFRLVNYYIVYIQMDVLFPLDVFFPFTDGSHPLNRGHHWDWQYDRKQILPMVFGCIWWFQTLSFDALMPGIVISSGSFFGLKNKFDVPASSGHV